MNTNSRRPLIGIPLYPNGAEDDGTGYYGGKRATADILIRLGALPVFLPFLQPVQAAAAVRQMDGILLPGGGDIDPSFFDEPVLSPPRSCDPELDRFEIGLTRAALENRRPLLAICRGVQVLNVALGGSLWQDIPSQVPGAVQHGGNARRDMAHEIEVEEGSRLAGIFGSGRLPVNSRHHQAAGRVADGLRVVARCPDDGIIEALEAPGDVFCLGIQFHPEDRPDLFEPLFEVFVREAMRKYRD